MVLKQCKLNFVIIFKPGIGFFLIKGNNCSFADNVKKKKKKKKKPADKQPDFMNPFCSAFVFDRFY